MIPQPPGIFPQAGYLPLAGPGRSVLTPATGTPRRASGPWRGVIDRFRQDLLGLFRRMEAGGVLPFDEVEHELRAALKRARQIELRVGCPRAARRLDVADERNERVHRAVAQREHAILNDFDPRLELLFLPVLARLASPVDVEHRAAHVMVADQRTISRPGAPGLIR